MAKKLGESANKDAKLPGREQLESVFKLYDAAKREAASAAGAVGEVVKKNEKKHNLHPGAFKLAVKLRGMDETKRAAFLAHLDHYIETWDLRAQGELFADAPAEGEDDELAPAKTPEPDPVAENVTRLKRGIKQLAH